MIWQLLAIWILVIATLVWFIRDERKRISDAALARSARHYARAPQYRHVSAEPATMPAPARRTGGLTAEQRRVFEALTKRT